MRYVDQTAPRLETVVSVGVLAGQNGRFTVHVIEYGLAKKRHADRALGCIHRDKARRFHLKLEP